MNTSSRILAALAYVLLVIGWLLIFLLQRDKELAVYHAKQAMVWTGMVVIVPVVWLVFTWLIAWIPFGFLVGVALFALVIAASLALLILWMLGISRALRGRMEPLPVIGKWAEQIPVAGRSTGRTYTTLETET